MGHTYTNLLVHLVFSTQGREPWLKAPVRERLFAYLGGIAQEAGAAPLCIGGVADHAHMLLALPGALSCAQAAQRVKGASARWIHETFADLRKFAWQEGYGAFSVSQSQIAATRRYIAGQEEHHRRRTFQEEFLAFLARNNVAYDARYIWT